MDCRVKDQQPVPKDRTSSDELDSQPLSRSPDAYRYLQHILNMTASRLAVSHSVAAIAITSLMMRKMAGESKGTECEVQRQTMTHKDQCRSYNRVTLLMLCPLHARMLCLNYVNYPSLEQGSWN